MNENELTGLLESLRRMGSDDFNVEVKESATTLSRDVWETVSAFANTAGGIIVLGVSERAGFVPVANFETEKVLNQFVAGMGDAGGRGKLANPPKYTIERVELQGTVVLVITIEELDPSSKPCYVIERGAQGGSYKRIDDKDVPLSSTEVLALPSYERTSPSDRDVVPGTSVGDLDESLVDRTIERAYSLTPRAMRGAADKKTKMERLNFLDFQGNVTKAGLLAAGVYPQQFYPKLFIDGCPHGNSKGSCGATKVYGPHSLRGHPRRDDLGCCRGRRQEFAANLDRPRRLACRLTGDSRGGSARGNRQRRNPSRIRGSVLWTIDCRRRL